MVGAFDVVFIVAIDNANNDITIARIIQSEFANVVVVAIVIFVVINCDCCCRFIIYDNIITLINSSITFTIADVVIDRVASAANDVAVGIGLGGPDGVWGCR